MNSSTAIHTLSQHIYGRNLLEYFKGTVRHFCIEKNDSLRTVGHAERCPENVIGPIESAPSKPRRVSSAKDSSTEQRTRIAPIISTWSSTAISVVRFGMNELLTTRERGRGFSAPITGQSRGDNVAFKKTCRRRDGRRLSTVSLAGRRILDDHIARHGNEEHEAGVGRVVL